ncbi:MAG: hypothetical protein Q8L98_03585 [Chlamydiales bacterium]|nr:hypothetical protein [Chlamydiales bacterium]
MVAIGGGGLLLLGMISRSTKDVDVVALVDHGDFISAKHLPIPLFEAIAEVGAALQLGENWMNTGPSDLFLMGLPEGFADRMSTSHYGGLILHLAGRFDQICFKLYASVDQGPRSIPKVTQKLAFGLRESAENRLSQRGLYWSILPSLR